ncbi:IS3 family transposase [Mycolicibacterium hippocampi]|uniref:IS3 family transposase n=1 Tax=Mycolicibacterium hippocampi TaxID=659824 RepID=UPI00351254F6
MFDSAAAWAARVGQTRACQAFGVSERTFRHRRQAAEGRLPDRPSQARPRHEWKSHPARLSDAERAEIATILCSEEFADLAPAQVYATLLDRGEYYCSERTMYRILHERDLVAERRRGHRRRPHEVPRVKANAPNQAWSYDISRLAGPVARSWFYLYVVIDIFSRKIVAWSVDTIESDKIVKRLIRTACDREGVQADQLVLHSDRGAQMTSTTIAELLETLGVTRSLSRPRTSNDNPHIEAAFKTAKYRPDYPARFADIAQARSWMRRFAHWYNHVHYHSGIGYLHPADVHAGRSAAIVADRQAVLDAAYAAHPERFPRGRPTADAPPVEAWINKPSIQTASAQQNT